MSNKPAALPIFGDAYLADTMHLSLEEHGAYFLLMLAAWRSPTCSLPDDDAKLARICRCSTKRFKGIRDNVLEMWDLTSEGWVQKRLKKERDYVSAKSAHNKRAAEARWNAQVTENIKNDECERISERNAPPPPPLKDTSEAKASSEKTPRSKSHPFPCPDGVDPQHWKDFLAARKRKGAVQTETAYLGVLRCLAEYATDEWPPGRLVQRSAEKGWGKIVNPNEQDHRNGTGNRNAPGFGAGFGRPRNRAEEMDDARSELGFNRGYG